MNKFKRILVGAVATLALATGLGVTSAQPAEAKVGGQVTNLSGSHRGITICGNWSAASKCKQPTRNLLPGQNSKKYFADTDGFVVPSGYHVHIGTLCYKEGKNYKVRDGQHIRLTVHKTTKSNHC